MAKKSGHNNDYYKRNNGDSMKKNTKMEPNKREKYRRWEEDDD